MGTRLLSDQDLIDQALKEIHSELDRAPSHFVLGLSGGESPKMLYSQLASTLTPAQLNKLVVFLIDERKTPQNPERLNQVMIQKFLLNRLNGRLTESQIFFPDVVEDAQKYHERLMRMTDQFGLPQMALMGIGEDGHTASFFPGEEKNWKDMDYNQLAIDCINPNINEARLSVSLSFLLKMKQLLFFVTGEKKLKVLQQIRNDEKYPAEFLRMRHP